jgi:glycosyltransferase involved in cell wall biosynthesis
MAHRPIVSVCVPTFNRAKFLAKSLESILRQSFSDFEVVVVDDASTDETTAVVQKFSEPRLSYYRNNHNLGQIENLNRCLELARGEYVCIFHDDDVYAPRILEREVDVLSRNPGVGLVHTAVWILSEAGRVRRVHRVSDSNYVRPGREAFLAYLWRAHDIVFSTAMVRASCYTAVGGFDPRFILADGDMWLRIALDFDIAYIAESLAGYRMHHASASRTMPPVRWFGEYFEIFDKNIKIARDRMPYLDEQQAQLLAEARRHQARRSRLEAAASIASGQYSLAANYIQVASELDPSLPGRAGDTILRAALNPLGRLAMLGLRFVRHCIHLASFGSEIKAGKAILE